jgi:hypothetical protein
MPYYVYAIHTDSTVNRLYDTFNNFADAQMLEAEMKRGRYLGDNYMVYMIHAEDPASLTEKIRVIRKDNNWPTS